jgi:hypothetical protein
MGALSFKGQFVPKVSAGLRGRKNGKRQSIRNYRKRPLKVGEKVYLYFAMRTKWCKKIGESVIKDVRDILITETSIYIFELENGKRKNGGEFIQYTSKRTLDKFAQADGFRSWEVMKRWWKLTHGPDALPFRGNLYKWFSTVELKAFQKKADKSRKPIKITRLPDGHCFGSGSVNQVVDFIENHLKPVK